MGVKSFRMNDRIENMFNSIKRLIQVQIRNLK